MDKKTELKNAYIYRKEVDRLENTELNKVYIFSLTLVSLRVHFAFFTEHVNL